MTAKIKWTIDYPLKKEEFTPITNKDGLSGIVLSQKSE